MTALIFEGLISNQRGANQVPEGTVAYSFTIASILHSVTTTVQVA